MPQTGHGRHCCVSHKLCEMRTIKRLIEDESGQDLIEYALVAALIGLGTIAGVQSLATVVGNMFTYVGTGITSAV